MPECTWSYPKPATPEIVETPHVKGATVAQMLAMEESRPVVLAGKHERIVTTKGKL